MKFAAGWGGEPFIRNAQRDATPPRLAFRYAQYETTLPLQGRVKVR
jgi:hypothetical protein